MEKYEDAKLRTFVTAAELGNFTAASRRLGISQPAVSQQIGELERLCGRDLFVRGRGEVALTPAGETFLRYARRILDGYGEMAELFGMLTAAARSTGHLTIAATAFAVALVLPRILGDIAAVSGLEVIMNTYPEAAFLSVMPPEGEDFQLFTANREEVLSGELAPYAHSSLSFPSGEKIYICLKAAPAFSGTALCRILVERLRGL